MSMVYRFCAAEPPSDGVELVDLSVVLAAEPADLCQEIARGDHDGSLAGLLECAIDPSVAHALRARAALLGA